MPDTTRIDTIYVKGADALDILNKTHEFYNSAWNNLALFGTFLIAAIGLIVPYIAIRYQMKQVRLDKDKMMTELTKYVTDAQKELEASLNEKYKKEFDITNNRTRGAMHSLNASLSVSHGDVAFGFINFLQSARYNLMCNENMNASTALNSAIGLLSHLDKSKIEQSRRQISNNDMTIEQFIELVQYEDKNYIMTDKFKELKQAYRDLPEKPQS